MAVDKLKVMLSFMREINDGNVPRAQDYGITSLELWDIVEICQNKGYITGATHAADVLFLEGTKLTFEGLEYLEQNSALMKAYKGLKEIREWLPL